MKVLLVNGSPHEKGCTYTALREVGGALEQAGVETQMIQLGTKPISGCIACGACRKLGRCSIDDIVNEFLEMAEAADGFVFGSPVHYAAVGGSMTSFLDRVFFAGGSRFQRKPGAGIVSARRGGTTAAFDQLNKYFTISEMPVVSSTYWNMVHGHTPQEVVQDLEGMQVMRVLGRNMAWLLKCIEAGRGAGVAPPEQEPRAITNFIR